MSSTRSSEKSVLRIGIVALTLATALVHLQLNFPDPVFILNGLGYLTLLAALFVPIPQIARYRNVVRFVLIGYAALAIFLWILIGARTTIGYIDKAIEIALISLLLIEARRSRP